MWNDIQKFPTTSIVSSRDNWPVSLVRITSVVLFADVQWETVSRTLCVCVCVCVCVRARALACMRVSLQKWSLFGDSLAVQWLGLSTFTAEGSIPD